MLKVIAGVATSFAGVAGAEVDETIRAAMGSLGAMARVDRAYAYRYVAAERAWEVVSEWCDAGIVPSLEPGELVPASRLPWAFDQLVRDDIFRLDRLEDLPPAAALERSRWEGQGLRSTIAVTLRREEKLVGIMGFDTLGEERVWSDEDVVLLRTVAKVFVQAWQRQRAELRLREAITEADRANRLKSEFLANMSHEVRTPLNGILGTVELLRGDMKDDEQEVFLETIHDSGRTLLTMFDGILDLAAIESGTLVLHGRECHPGAILEEVAADFDQRAGERSCRIEFTVASGVPDLVVIDALRVRQILTNLVDNALKFSESSIVDLRLDYRSSAGAGGELLFQVGDRGAGIPAVKREMIFEAFTQLDGSSTRSAEGLGMGLTICRNLIRLFAGEISVDDRPGGGSIFSFTIPVADS